MYLWLYLFFCYFKMVYQAWRPLDPSAPRGNNKFEILLVKVFSLKQKSNQMLPVTIEKNQILSLQVNSLMFLQTTKFVEINNHGFK